MRPDSGLTATSASLGLILLLGLVTAYRAWVLAHSGLSLYVDEAYYWGWAQRLDWGYYSKPPLIAVLIAATTALCGHGVFCVKLGALLLYPLTTFFVFKLGAALFSPRTGLWAAALFLLMPGVALSNLIISTDVLLLLFWAMGLWALVKALEHDRWHHWLMLGLATGLGLLSKYTMVLFAPSLLLTLLLVPVWRRHLRNPRLWLAAALAVLIFLPNLFWNAAHGWPTLRHTAEISHLHEQTLHWAELLAFWGGQFAVFGPLALVLALVAALRLERTPQVILLVVFTFTFLAIISLQAFLGRANANWAAPAFVAASVLLAHWGGAHAHGRWLLAALALNVALMLGAYHYERITAALGVELSARTDPFKRVRGWDRLAEQFIQLRANHPQALLVSEEREVLAELAYYAQLPPEQVLSWNPHGLLRHQYDLMHPLHDVHRGQDVLYVTSAREPGPIVHHFAASEPLGALYVPIHRDWALEYWVFLLRDYKG